MQLTVARVHSFDSQIAWLCAACKEETCVEVYTQPPGALARVYVQTVTHTQTAINQKDCTVLGQMSKGSRQATTRAPKRSVSCIV